MGCDEGEGQDPKGASKNICSPLLLVCFKMQVLFADDVELSKLVWLLGAQAAQEESMPCLECNQITRGGKGETQWLLAEFSDSSRAV